MMIFSYICRSIQPNSAMKRTVKIFIACAKELKEQRDKIKALASDLSVEYRPLGVVIDIRSYENFGDEQTVYNSFIEREADVILFVLDGGIGVRTEEELILASQCFRANRHPEVMVFVRKDGGRDIDIAHIEGLMRGALDRYYVEYKDDIQLASLVKDRLRKYITRRPKPFASTSRAYFRRNKLLMSIIASLIVVSVVSWIYFMNRSEAPLLVFGGGSTAKVIENMLGGEINSLHNVYYVRMPSKNAWSIIKDELAHPTQSDNYSLACISATAASTNDFSSIGQSYKSNPATVVFVPLGHDTLKVYLRNGPALTSDLRHQKDETPCITDEELCKLLAKPAKEHNLFTTSTESGTFAMYASLLQRADSTMILENLDRDQFFDNTNLATLNNSRRPYILLGARNYYPKEALYNDINDKEKKCLSLSVVDHNNINEQIVMHHFMYFVAYPTEETNKEDERQISPNVVRFLQRLGISTGNKIRNFRIKVRDKRALVHIDSLEDWHQ